MTALSKEQLAEAIAAKCARLFFENRRDVAPMREHQLAAVCESAITLAMLEHDNAPAPAVTWVEWKPGDGMPASGEYWVTLATGTKVGYARQLSTKSDWSHWEVIAYWPIALPPPYAAPAREKV